MSRRTPAQLTGPQARAIALAAQGFGDAPPTGRVDRRHVRRAIGRTGLLQIDSVNVLVRAHYMPLYSRLGGYDPRLLDRMAYTPERELFEYWGHEASLIPVHLHPLFRWRMAQARDHAWGGLRDVAAGQPELVAAVRQIVADHGPLSAAEIEGHHPGPSAGRKGSWWDWSHVKRAVEYLFWAGEVTTSSRRGFERLYDLPERVLPASVLAAPEPEPAEAIAALVEAAALRLGVATAADLRDYFRLPLAETTSALTGLVEDGRLTQVAVDDWRKPAFLHVDARIPRVGTLAPHTLVSPFDPLVWNRDRTQRLFGMRYRIEIYVPEAQRVHGYYVLPFLEGDALTARVDLKADRARRTLVVAATHLEANARPTTVPALAAELQRMADWLGLEEIEVAERGDGARGLARAMRGIQG